MKTVILVVLLGLLTSCNACKKYSFTGGIEKGEIIYSNRMEGSPVIFNNELYHIISDRFETQSIQIFKGNVLFNSYKTNGHLISALVDNNIVYIFSTIDEQLISMTSSSDLIHFTNERIIYKSTPDIKIFNTSVAKDPTGFILAFEICKTGQICFNSRFLHSDDLDKWAVVGSTFSPNEYAACPTIRYDNGFYYLFYLKYTGKLYETHVSRSKDLITWEYGNVVLSPSDNKDLDSINNSDFDLIEYNGNVVIQYAEGNQASENGWANIRNANYVGSMSQFLESFFK